MVIYFDFYIIPNSDLGFLKSNLIEFFKNLNIKKEPEYMISNKMVFTSRSIVFLTITLSIINQKIKKMILEKVMNKKRNMQLHHWLLLFLVFLWLHVLFLFGLTIIRLVWNSEHHIVSLNYLNTFRIPQEWVDSSLKQCGMKLSLTKWQLRIYWAEEPAKYHSG